MTEVRTAKVAGMTVLAGVLSLALAGCSSPKADFEAVCEANSGDAEGCACMGERLDNNLGEEQFAELVALMRDENASIEEVGGRLNEHTFQELMIAAKQCGTRP